MRREYDYFAGHDNKSRRYQHVRHQTVRDCESLQISPSPHRALRSCVALSIHFPASNHQAESIYQSANDHDARKRHANERSIPPSVSCHEHCVCRQCRVVSYYRETVVRTRSTRRAWRSSRSQSSLVCTQSLRNATNNNKTTIIRRNKKTTTSRRLTCQTEGKNDAAEQQWFVQHVSRCESIRNLVNDEMERKKLRQRSQRVSNANMPAQRDRDRQQRAIFAHATRRRTIRIHYKWNYCSQGFSLPKPVDQSYRDK
jgi:hypothetical protein